MILVAISIAAAGALGSMDAHPEAWFDDTAITPALALGVRGGLLVGDHVDLGLSLEGGAHLDGAPVGAARLDLRWLPGDVRHGGPSGWIGLAGGGVYVDGVGIAGGPELGLELPLGAALARVEATAQLGTLRYAGLALGFGWRRRERVPEPVVAAPPAPVAPRSGTMVWIPHPWCEWLPIEDAGSVLASLPAGTRVRVLRPGFLPMEVDPSAAGTVGLEPEPPRGGLTIGGSTGDVVRLDGNRVGLGTTGSATTLSREGRVTLDVVGGGRLAHTTFGVTSGRALWVDLPDPEPARIHFGLNSAVLDGAATDTLQNLALRIGDYGYVVVGSASPEGDVTQNTRLAEDRARVVRDALVAAGVPADRVTVGPVESLDVSLPPEEQRVALVRPVVRP